MEISRLTFLEQVEMAVLGLNEQVPTMGVDGTTLVRPPEQSARGLLSRDELVL